MFIVVDDDKDNQIVELKRRLCKFQDEEAKLAHLFITGNMSEETYKQLRMQILIKRIIVDSDGEIINIGLNSPFMYLHSLVTGFYSEKQGSDQTPVGAQSEPLNIKTDIGRFLSLIRFEQRGKLEELNLNI